MRDNSTFMPILIWFVAGIALLVAFVLIETPFVATMLMPPVAIIYIGVAGFSSHTSGVRSRIAARKHG